MLSIIGRIFGKLQYNEYKGCEKYDKYEFKTIKKNE
ncbi:hypothetical protein EDD66_11243 [Mobilisporobacter senegalensis]|uniref:Uncharacterized protein n=1 Tax=Mobilisporobacter senegalensis TaxID=1329262 RepID=A0A3N1XFX3_9FIRM|nr:hypothetical protein EDD66_11243 [Mobilisporobacter senegalensis]